MDAKVSNFSEFLKLADKVFPYILQIFIVRTRPCEW